MKKDHSYHALEAKRLRNDQLRSDIEKVELEIEELEERYKRVDEKYKTLKYQYQSIKESFLWKTLKRLKRIAHVTYRLISGKKRWRHLLSSHKKKRAHSQIKKLKYRLYDLGFTKRAIGDLKDLIEKSDNKYIKKLASWELLLWYANQYSYESAEKGLELIPYILKGEKDESILRKVSILEAECLEVLGKTAAGKQVIQRALSERPHSDLYLAAANLESTLTGRFEYINKALQLYGIESISLDNSNDHTAPYDSIRINKRLDNGKINIEQPLVSIILPVFNGAKFIKTSIESILNQTWGNIELLVVDDCSTDETVSIINEYAHKDSRVHLLQTMTNGGAYAARNMALKAAKGEYVTINDADDWSHPEKIERQAIHLLANSTVIANTSEQARATEKLKFYRRGKPGSYIFSNMSSLMFRRKPVLDSIGYWDEVRFGADGEFKKRLNIVFGKDAVVDLKTGPLSFQRQTENSLTGNQVFGYHGYFMGARKEYFESYSFYHKSADSLKYSLHQQPRLFPVPEPMWTVRDDQRHFDVIIASEFRLLGGTNMSNIEEIKAQTKMGLRTGLVQISRYDFDSEKQINPKVRELIDGNQVQMLVYGENVSCDLLIVRHPPGLQEWQKYIPKIDARSIKVIINQPPKREYSNKGSVLYDIKRCAVNLQEFFGKEGKWYPIGPLIRETLYEHHSKDLKAIKFSKEDWVNIIDVSEWKRQNRPIHTSKIKVGRHSRSQYVKWPNDPKQLLTIYPDSEKYEIHILGGADVPEKILGRLPSNWRVLEFGELAPREFLAGLDVFVYYTHPDWVESFGRVILEAMAVGVPVIISPIYKNLFGDAAIYAEPSEVETSIDQLMNDSDLYHKQVIKAQAFVDENFGYKKHASRLRESIIETHV